MRLLPLILLTPPLLAQSISPLDRMLESKFQVTAYLAQRAREITSRAGAEIASPAQWEAVRAKRLEEMRDMLGLLPWPDRTPLNVRITARLDKGAYTVENIAFESMPKVYVTGNLYLPKAAGRKPAIIYVCGHAYSPHGDKTVYQRHGISFAKNGYAAFILDSIQIAETFALHHGVGWQEMPDWYSRGYTPAGVEVWNAMRAIDYLETRPEVDPSRIGMTGRSGGAAMTWFTAAVDPRVRAAAPVMGISTYAANLIEDTQRLHCDCMFTVNSWMHDMMHQGALIFPRPLRMMHGSRDALFPVAGYEEFETKMERLYAAAGKADSFDNVVVDTGHADSDYLREQAIRFFDRHLLGESNRKLDMDYSNADPATLAAFSGKPPSDARNMRVHEFFTTRPPSQRYSTAAAWNARAAQLRQAIDQKVLAARPPGELKVTEGGAVDGWTEVTFTAGDGVAIRTLVKRTGRTGVPALLYVASEGEDPRAISATLSGASRLTAAVFMAVYPRGIGEISWDKSFTKAALRNAMHTGLTVDTMRLWDVYHAVQLLQREPGVDPARILIMGRGVSGILGLYAAILIPAVHQVMLADPPESHVQGPTLLNILRHTDLPEAAALLAPRRLNFYARMPAAYEYTRHIYSLLGKGDHVFLAMQIEGVLDGRYHHDFASGF
jgi:dienelactone hydrolase